MRIIYSFSIILKTNSICSTLSREGNDPSDEIKITYGELLDEVCKFANVLKSFGITKGESLEDDFFF